MTRPALRNRVHYAFAALLVVAAGLASRRWGGASPWAQAPGDALWATLVFVLVGIARPAWSTGKTAAVALAMAFAVEASQAVHVPWLDAVRRTLPGRLVLGTSFYAPDLLAYAVGVALGAWVEIGVRARARPG